MKRTAYKRTVVAGALLLGLGLPTPAVTQRREGLPEGGRPVEPVAVDRPVALLPAELLSTAAVAVGVLWDLPVTRNAQVETWIDFLRGRNREKTGLWLQRSGRYAPMIRQALRQRGMPEDLVYLAFIESGFSPGAYSRAQAAGIWQFIAETGRRYGLEVSSYVDERRDPLKATVAALDYLQKLHGQFGNWYLAAAAYNSGENRVARVLRERREDARGTEELFWRIAPHLPQETRDYVPLMLAAGHIGKEPEKYGFVNLSYHVPLTFETVAVPGGTRLSTVARAIEVAADDVEELNPHLVRKMTPPGRLTEVRIPPGRDTRVAFHRTR
jgi:membrane-bound lytic murein transglycosylase D